MKEIIITGIVLFVILLILKRYLKKKRQRKLKQNRILEGQHRKKEVHKPKFEYAKTSLQLKQEKPPQQFEYLDKFGIEYLYHMTHKNNIPNILQNGLLSHNQARNSKLIQSDIADPQVNDRRARKEPIYHRSIHDYVPLYFNPKNPMLYRRGNLQNNIVILAIDRKILYQPNILFTNGNAAANATLFFCNIKDLISLNWRCINAEYWNDIPDGKRIKCSEVLIFPKIPTTAIRKVFCNNHQTKQFAENLLNNHVTIDVEVKPNLYFSGFFQNDSTTHNSFNDFPF